MKKSGAYKISVGLLGAFVLFGAGCGDSGYSSSKSMDVATESAAESYDESDGLYSYEDEVVNAEEGEGSAAAEQVSEEDASSNQSKRKLITNISMSVETREFDSLISFIKKRTNELGGYIENESINNNSYGVNTERYGHMIIRVPETKLDSFLTDVSDKSNILSQDRSVTDVTLQYADLESHKKALLAEQEQLLALMEKAETIEEILQIQNQLTDVRYQLESMESQLRTYDNQVTYSTVDMSVNEVIEYTPDAPPSFGERAAEGFMENLNAVKNFFVELILAIITHIPVLVLLIVIIAAVVAIIRVIDAKAKKSRMKKMKNGPVLQGGAPYGVPNQRPDIKNVNPMQQNTVQQNTPVQQQTQEKKDTTESKQEEKSHN